MSQKVAGVTPEEGKSADPHFRCVYEVADAARRYDHPYASRYRRLYLWRIRVFCIRVSEELFWQDVTLLHLVNIYRQFGGPTLFVNLMYIGPCIILKKEE